MTRHKVEENIFPLKDKGKGGNFAEWYEIYESKLQQLKKHMFSLRDEFGSHYYNADGDRVIIEVVQAGNAKNGTYPQARWTIYKKRSTRRTNILGPVVYSVNSLQQEKSKSTLLFLRQMQLTSQYERFLSTEKERVLLNARAKALQKNMLYLNEIIATQTLEKHISRLLGQNSSQLDLFK